VAGSAAGLRFVPLAAIVLAGVPLLLRLRLLRVRSFDADEFQHLHSAWSISKGLLPYRDYFEHHMPLLHLLSAPLFSLFEVETSSDEAIAFLFTSRLLMWLCTAAILAFTFRLGVLFEGRAVGWAGALLLSSSLLFLEKTLEFRPDVPACLLLLAAACVLLQALERHTPFASRAFGASGLLLGAGLLFTLKLVFALLGIVPLLVAFAARGSQAERPARTRSALAFAAGLAMPGVVTLLYFAGRGALFSFLECTLLVNARWKTRFSPLPILSELAVQNTGLVALAACGFALLLARNLRDHARVADRALLLFALGPFAGLWLIPVPWHQYYLTFLPQAAVLAASALVWAFRLVPKLGERGRDAALAGALFLLSLGPLGAQRESFARSNLDKLASIRFVIENTRPDESVMDGYTGIGVFRPHAYRYYFLHAELRAMLGEAERREVLEGLRSGALAPRLISFDGHLSRLSPEIRAFFEEHYASVEQGPLWARLPPRRAHADDAGWRPLAPDPELPRDLARDLFVGVGWESPEREGSLRYRRSRGRRSELWVPLVRPESDVLRLRARAGSRVPDLGFIVEVNGHRLGHALAEPRWREYTFEVAAERLKAGLNRVALRYPQTPARARPGAPGPNSVLAVESLAFERRGAER
jgi:hypothetical protein